MAVGDYDILPFTGPVGTDQVAYQIRGNDNVVREKFVAHQADEVAHLQSGLASARPASGTTTGETYLATDTGVLSVWNGSAWVENKTGSGDVVGDDTSTTVQNIVAYNTTGGKNITELTGTQGDVLYHNGTSWAKLAAGTSGNFLKTNGAGANPAWAAVAAGDVTADDTSTTVQNIVAYNTTGGKNITELTGAQGDILYHNGTSWVKLGAGTSGNYLKTNGTGANPAWSNIPGLTFALGNLHTVTPGNSTSRFYAQNGDATSPGYSFVADAGNGMGRLSVGGVFFSVASQEKHRINVDGYSKFSNNGAYINAAGLYHELRSNSSTEYSTRLSNSHATTPNGLRIDFTGGSPDNNTQVFLLCQDSTAARCYIWADGDLANHDGTYGTISDERLKQDIIDAPSQWDDVKAIRFRKYRMKSDVAQDPDAPYMLGVVAQEIAQTSPMLVDEHPEYEDRDVVDADGNVTTERVQVRTVKTVKSSILLTKAAKALQEAMARIEALEAEMAALKATLSP